MELLENASEIAQKAGDVLMNFFGSKVKFKKKNDLTPVSEADFASNELITDLLSVRFPKHHILSEESEAQTGLQEGFNWVIDPLDGTSNFLHGLPYFCVSIACVEKKTVGGEEDVTILAGVVFNPATKELFKAAVNQGAYLGTAQLGVSGTNSIAESFIACGYHGDDDSKVFRDSYIALNTKADGSRRMGAAALDLAKTAEGVFDVFFDPVLKPWDIAAGALLVSEAGGLARNFPGHGDSKQFDLLERGIIAGNAELVQKVSRVFAG